MHQHHHNQDNSNSPQQQEPPSFFAKLARYFPPAETKSLRHIEALLADKPHIYHKDEGNDYVLLYGEFEDFVFVDYMLVDSSARGRGIGRELLCKLKEKQKIIVLEVDPIDEADEEGGVESDSSKRVRFYIREGFVKAPNIHYTHRARTSDTITYMQVMYWLPPSSRNRQHNQHRQEEEEEEEEQEDQQEIILKMFRRAYNEIHAYRVEELYGRAMFPDTYALQMRG